MTLLNRYARQQRLNPAEVRDPAMRSMMDAVRSVYDKQDASTEEDTDGTGPGGEEISIAEVPAEENKSN